MNLYCLCASWLASSLESVAAVVHNHPSQGVILFPGLVKHIIDDSAELFKFLITVTHLRRLGGNRVVFD